MIHGFARKCNGNFAEKYRRFVLYRHNIQKRIVFSMYKAARDVHTNGIHNTFTSKGRGKMNHIKQFFREKGLYLFCLAMVFAATAAGILALRTVVSNVADLTRTRKERCRMIPPGHSPTPPSTSPRRTCPSRRPHPPQRKSPRPPLRLLQRRPRRSLLRRPHRPSPSPVSGTRSRWRRQRQ